tara:strand:+ start:1350 stop:1532 length:183 start_codon:yes stop_codon:yes gene_type:complete
MDDRTKAAVIKGIIFGGLMAVAIGIVIGILSGTTSATRIIVYFVFGAIGGGFAQWRKFKG